MMLIILKTFKCYAWRTQVWNNDVSNLISVSEQIFNNLFVMLSELEILSRKICSIIVIISLSMMIICSWLIWAFYISQIRRWECEKYEILEQINFLIKRVNCLIIEFQCEQFENFFKQMTFVLCLACQSSKTLRIFDNFFLFCRKFNLLIFWIIFCFWSFDLI
jgi:hypothetical protein